MASSSAANWWLSSGRRQTASTKQCVDHCRQVRQKDVDRFIQQICRDGVARAWFCGWRNDESNIGFVADEKITQRRAGTTSRRCWRRVSRASMNSFHLIVEKLDKTSESCTSILSSGSHRLSSIASSRVSPRATRVSRYSPRTVLVLLGGEWDKTMHCHHRAPSLGLLMVFY